MFLWQGGSSFNPVSTWDWAGTQTTENAGWSVSGAGDVNADGYDDVVIGRPGWDRTSSLIDVGAVSLFFGTGSGLSPGIGGSLMGVAIGDGLGVSVAAAGDVDGDGYADVLAGAPTASGLFLTGNGTAYLVGGGATWPGTTLWTGYGASSGDRFGAALDGLGDVNGDGYSDWAVGAPYVGNVATVRYGVTYGYYGSSATRSGFGTAQWTTTGAAAFDLQGSAVSAVGDVNGDGFAELATGAIGRDNGNTDEGSVTIFAGSASAVAVTASASTEANLASARLGVSVATGDLNSDGIDDIVYGAPGWSNPEVGEGRVMMANGGTTIAWASTAAEPNQAGAASGQSVVVIGDLDGDGYAETAAGAPYWDEGTTADNGRVKVYTGSIYGATTGTFLQSFGPAGSRFGHALSVCDWNGDGRNDLAVSAPGYSSGQSAEGRVSVHFAIPSTLATVPAWTSESNQSNAQLGLALGAADTNGDGYCDLLVGTPLWDQSGADAGRVQVYLGSASGLATSPVREYFGAAGDQLGYAVAGLGDVDGDGYEDIGVGSPLADNGGTDAGRFRLFLGSATGPASAAVRSIDGLAGDQLGSAIAGVGDVDGDTLSDFAIGAPYGEQASGKSAEGIVYVYEGPSTGSQGPATTLLSAQSDAHLGMAIAGGDIDGDGFSDVIAAAPDYDNGQADEGRLFVHRGNGADTGAVQFRPQARTLKTTLSTMLSPQTRSDSTTSFGVAANVRMPMGAGWAQLNVARRTQGASIAGASLTNVGTGTFVGATGSASIGNVIGLTADGRYHWRGRFTGAMRHAWESPRSHWFSGKPTGRRAGLHVRTACAADLDADGLCTGVDPDDDGDGWATPADCADANPAIHPGATEIAGDGVDQDCDGADMIWCYVDSDGDGFGVEETKFAEPAGLCAIGSSSVFGDCDDGDATINPDAAELCDQADTNCDNVLDINEFDIDGDTLAACDGDCDENDPNTYPGAAEICDGVDNDCSGSVPANEADGDSDGWSACGGDCADGNGSVWPGAPEACDGLDTNCDGVLPPSDLDADLDGVIVCEGDCDDSRSSVHPGAAEVCDGWDTDCSGTAGPGEVDVDGDGYFVCEGDCNDSNPSINPGAPETCDGVDNNCVAGITDEGADADADGVTTCADCDDSDNNVRPGAVEICDGKDGNCDGNLPAPESDADADGYMPCTIPGNAHPVPGLAGGDCDNQQPTVYPGAPELCDGLDNNCVSGVPASESDLDLDGFRPCSGDCDDVSPTRYPGAPEACNGLDDDCNSVVPANEADNDFDTFLVCAGDCADGAMTRYPGAPELCNGLDDDCDSAVPSNEADGDADGYRICGGDCLDTNASVRPGAVEVCDGFDTNCDGTLPPSESDDDGDGFDECGGDCDDADAGVGPVAPEVCDGIDQDCDTVIDDGFDEDGDGQTTCEGDCDDTEPAVFLGAVEICDGLDDDCDGSIDEGYDQDGDGSFVPECPGGGDCDDFDASVHSGAAEACDALDNDCDGDVDEDWDGDGRR